MDSKAESNAAETAFCWRVNGKYGSESKAIRALRSRKGMNSLDADRAKEYLSRALAILERAVELRSAISKSLGKPDVTYLTKVQFEDGLDRLKTSLDNEFPGLEITTTYMVNMLWCMPYLR